MVRGEQSYQQALSKYPARTVLEFLLFENRWKALHLPY